MSEFKTSDYFWWFVDHVYDNRLTPSEGAAACTSGATVGGAGTGYAGAGAGCVVTIISNAITKLIMGRNYNIPIDPIPIDFPTNDSLIQPMDNENNSCPYYEGSDSCPTTNPCPTTCQYVPTNEPTFDYTYGPPTCPGSDGVPTVSGNDGFSGFYN